MNDRELLELAAKAARIFDPLKVMQQDPNPHYWNPLTDDGDALRLAVKLKLELNHDDLSPTVSVCGPTITWVDERYEDDPCAAARRAIVRAATEIGKGMV